MEIDGRDRDEWEGSHCQKMPYRRQERTAIKFATSGRYGAGCDYQIGERANWSWVHGNDRYWTGKQERPADTSRCCRSFGFFRSPTTTSVQVSCSLRCCDKFYSQ